MSLQPFLHLLEFYFIFFPIPVNFLFNSINIPHLFKDFTSITPAVVDINIVWSKFCKSHSHLVCVSLLVRLFQSFSFDVSHLFWPSPLVETIRTGSKAGSGKNPVDSCRNSSETFLYLLAIFSSYWYMFMGKIYCPSQFPLSHWSGAHNSAIVSVKDKSSR